MMEQRWFLSANLLERRAEVFAFPAITLLLVLATLLGAGMNAPAILALLAAGVVCLGLPHGSLDPLVARKLFGANPRFTMAGFLAVYALLSVLCAIGWVAAPNAALSIFLVISAVHFGSDWQQRGSFWSRTAYGACVVTVPTLRHAETVRQIYVALGARDAAGIISASKIVAWSAATVAILSLLPQVRRRWRDCLELVVILIAGIALPPLVFFVCYFCLLHSPRHLAETSREVGLQGIGAIAKAVVPTVAVTLLLAAALWSFLPENRPGGRILEIIFIGLAALTVPHMLLTEFKDLEQRSTLHQKMFH
jgi:Brp/Blh family beta-carotene 15,15'-monooxygenase